MTHTSTLWSLQLVLTAVAFCLCCKKSSSFFVPSFGGFQSSSPLFLPSSTRTKITTIGTTTSTVPTTRSIISNPLFWKTQRGLTSSSTNEEEFIMIEAEDLESIEEMFTKYCDRDGLMTKRVLQTIPYLENLLEDGDLAQEELNTIWNAVPKSPNRKGSSDRIDVASFVQIYRDIDDLFEYEDDDDDDDEEEEEEDDNDAERKNDTTTTSSDMAVKAKEKVVVVGSTTASTTDADEEEEELKTIFESICDNDGLISKQALRDWEEVQKLLADGLLDEEELDDLWKNAPKSPRSNKDSLLLDVDGFLSFNDALDRLFEFVDDDDDVDDANENEENDDENDDDSPLSPSMLFASIANEDYLVGMKELQKWDELQDMIAEGEISKEELQTMYDNILLTTNKNSNKKTQLLNEPQFIMLYEQIDDLFEDIDDDDDDDDDTAKTMTSSPTAATTPDGSSAENSSSNSSSNSNDISPWKQELLRAITILNSDEDLLPCGLESTDREQEKILAMVTKLEMESCNLLRQRQQQQQQQERQQQMQLQQETNLVEQSDLVGTWELVYTSSSAMKFNQGLSGLGGSVPNGKFGGLKQILKGNKFVSDVQYIERIVVQPDAASFDVIVNGDWDIRTSVSLFTGQPSVVLNIVPDKVMYGPTSTRADHWKSLGPTNMLDISYIDDNLRIMRGSTSTDTLFIYKKISSSTATTTMTTT